MGLAFNSAVSLFKGLINEGYKYITLDRNGLVQLHLFYPHGNWMNWHSLDYKTLTKSMFPAMFFDIIDPLKHNCEYNYKPMSLVEFVERKEQTVV